MYTVLEVASICKVHTETVRRWIRDGKLNASGKGVKGARYAISEQDLLEFRKQKKTNYFTTDPSSQTRIIRNELLRIRKEIDNLLKMIES